MPDARLPYRPSAAAALTALLLAAAGAATAASRYDFVNLGPLAGSDSVAYAINGAGHAAGSSDSVDGLIRHAVVWRDGERIDLGPAGQYGVARGINDAGAVAGDLSIGDGSSWRATRWEGGGHTLFDTLGGASSHARAINACGLLVGFSDPASGPPHATLWQGPTEPVDLGTLGGTSSSAQAVNALGAVAGYSATPGNEAFHAVRWDADGATDLGTLGDRRRKDSFAYGINDAGTIVGAGVTDGGATHAVRWQDGGLDDLGTLGGRDSFAYGVNNLGQIVGTSDPSADTRNPKRRRATLWENGSVIDLNRLIPHHARQAGWVLTAAYAINDRGEIAGAARNKIDLGVDHGFLLRPRNAAAGSPTAPRRPAVDCSRPAAGRPHAR